MTVIAYGPVLDPLTAGQSGDPGAAVTYTLSLTNTSLAEDTFALAANSQGWTSAVTEAVGPLAAGAGETVTVTVSIPMTAAGGAQNVTTLVATSQEDSNQSAQASLTTTANNIYRATVTPTTSIQPGSAGAIISHTLWLTNSGNTTSTFSLSISGNSWPIVTPLGRNTVAAVILTEPLAAGAGDSLDLLALIPAGTPLGATDTATMTISLSPNSTPLTTATLTTIVSALAAEPEPVYLPMVIKR
jgi:hypothetical protein